MALLQDPRGLQFTRWAAAVVDDIAGLPLPMSERFWKGWARAVYQTQADVPNPDVFINWEDWAFAWQRSV